MASKRRDVVDLTDEDDYVIIEKSMFHFQSPSKEVSQPGFTSSRTASVFSTNSSVSSRVPSIRSPFQSPSNKSSLPKSPVSFSGSPLSRTPSSSSTTSEASPFQVSKSNLISPRDEQVDLARGLFKSTWKFPAEFSRSYSPVSKLEFSSPTSNQADRRSSKRRLENFSYHDSESPLKRRNTSIIEIPSDSEDDYEMISRCSTPSVESLVSLPESRRSSTRSGDIAIAIDPKEIIEIDLDEEEGYLYNEEDIFAERARTPDLLLVGQTTKRSKKSLAQRNAPITAPWTSIPMRAHNDIRLKALDTVELADGDFLRIKKIVEHSENGAAMLRGWRLRRAHKMEAMLDHKLNEVCWLFDIDLDDPRPLLEQSVDEVAIDEVVKIRELKATNQKFPACRFEPRIYQQKGKDWVYDNSELVVRWKYITTFANARDRVDSRFRDRRLEFLRESDCTEEHLAVCDEVRRRIFNESMVAGGSSTAVKQHIKALRKRIVSLEEDDDLLYIEDDMGAMSLTHRHADRHQGASIHSQNRAIDLISSNNDAFELGGTLTGSFITPPRRCERKAGQKYTYGDFFSGGGGASRGAQLAGLDVRFGLDFWSDANNTYRKNFPNATIYEMFSDELIMEMGNKSASELYVDILHISPPCQYWSLAHTRPGKDDERNMATLFSVMGLLMVVKPRIVTLEQTFGLHTPHFRPYFNGLVNMITTLGYSVTWSIAQLADWGLPQSRKRLIMIASAPGEVLPSFPARTHNKDGSNGLKRYLTINDILHSIPANSPDHDKLAAAFAPDKLRAPYDGDTQAKCITTSGGQNNYHPSGMRQFTIRELAYLQTFPPHHQFLGSKTSMRKQIGNAVPSKALGKTLFSHIRRHLESFDGVVQKAHSVRD